MKSLIFAAVAALCFAGSTQAAGTISANDLSAMGLSGVTIVTDFEAADVRGFGYSSKGKTTAIAGGSSYAAVPGADSHNYYKAIGNKSASGETYSEAGTSYSMTIKKGHKKMTITKSLSVYAGGYSSASAH